jgi:hypothetical protein
MCLAEDIGCHMYYQDTDSFFIEYDDLPMLKEAFKNEYGRELEGKDLGQFHPDFSSMTGRSDVKYANEMVFVAKKLYCGKLVMSDDSVEITYRSKGISLNSLDIAYKNKHSEMSANDAIFQSYLDILGGETIEVDLCKGAPKFKFNRDFSVESLPSFKRKINGVFECL